MWWSNFPTMCMEFSWWHGLCLLGSFMSFSFNVEVSVNVICFEQGTLAWRWRLYNIWFFKYTLWAFSDVVTWDVCRSKNTCRRSHVVAVDLNKWLELLHLNVRAIMFSALDILELVVWIASWNRALKVSRVFGKK